jgi:hypothetical protein
MSLDYLPLAFRRTHHIHQIRAQRAGVVQPMRQPDSGETPLSPAEVQHGISQGILRSRISDFVLTKRGDDL